MDNTKNKIVVEGIKNINLEHIFECGQCFRYDKLSDGAYRIVALGSIADFKAEGGALEIYNTSLKEYREIWHDYLDLDRDYAEIIEQISKEDEVMKTATREGYGIRILRQDPWETLISFIISQNNNIPRIRGCIESLCRIFGRPIEKVNEGGSVYYSFPSPEALAEASPRDIEKCKLGYRAQYILKTAKQVIDYGEKNFAELREKSFEEVMETLQRFNGVGPKVAHCVALFGFGKTEAFPIDTWIKKVMHQLYGIDEDDVEAMSRRSAKQYGSYAGIAQQYLFFYGRNRKGIVKKYVK